MKARLRLGRACQLLLAAVLLLEASPAAAARVLVQAPAARAPETAGAAAATTEVPPPAAETTAAAPSPEVSGMAQQSPFGGPVADLCVQLTNSAGQACTVESDTLSLVYSRGSEELPTPDQVSTAISNMKAAAQPSKSCCTAFQPYSDSRCPCDAGYQQLLPIGGFDKAYFEGATSILAQACGFSFPPCQPGEMAKVNGTGR